MLGQAMKEEAKPVDKSGEWEKNLDGSSLADACAEW